MRTPVCHRWAAEGAWPVTVEMLVGGESFGVCASRTVFACLAPHPADDGPLFTVHVNDGSAVIQVLSFPAFRECVDHQRWTVTDDRGDVVTGAEGEVWGLIVPGAGTYTVTGRLEGPGGVSEHSVTVEVGGGCGCGGSSPAWLPPVAAALGLRRRRPH